MASTYDTGDYEVKRGGDNVVVSPRALLVGGKTYEEGWNWKTNLCRNGVKPEIDDELKAFALDMKPKPQKRPDGIEEMTSGQLQAIVVRKLSNGQLEVVAGFRRVVAIDWLIESGEWPDAKIICAPPRTMTDEEAVLVNVAENMHRKDLKPVESAHTVRSLLEDYHFTPKQVAGRLKMSVSHINSLLQVTGLPSDIQDDVVAGGTTLTGAIELTKVADKATQREVFNELKATKGQKVRAADIRKVVRRKAEEKGVEAKGRRTLMDVRAFFEARSGKDEDAVGRQFAKTFLRFIDGSKEKPMSDMWEKCFPRPAAADAEADAEVEVEVEVAETGGRKKRAS